jgi:hypothetical protein
MTLTIELPPEVEEALRDEAKSRDSTPEELAAEAVRQRFAGRSKHDPSRLSSEERLALLRSIGRPAGVSVPDEALSSEGLYD